MIGGDMGFLLDAFGKRRGRRCFFFQGDENGKKH